MENEERVIRCDFVKLAHVCVGITKWLVFVGFTEPLRFVVCQETPLFGPCGRKGKHLSCEEVCLRRGAAIVYRHFPFACAAPYSGSAVRSNGCGPLPGSFLPMPLFTSFRPGHLRIAYPLTPLFCFLPACIFPVATEDLSSRKMLSPPPIVSDPSAAIETTLTQGAPTRHRTNRFSPFARIHRAYIGLRGYGMVIVSIYTGREK